MNGTETDAGTSTRRYLTPHEAAAVLGVSKAKMRDWLGRNEAPPAIRAGRRLWRYEKRGLYAWLDRQQQVSA